MLYMVIHAQPFRGREEFLKNKYPFLKPHVHPQISTAKTTGKNTGHVFNVGLVY